MSSRDYPRMMFHRTREPVVVQSRVEEDALGPDWSRIIWPASAIAEPEPAAVPEPEKPKKPEKPKEPEPEQPPASPEPEKEHEPAKHPARAPKPPRNKKKRG